MIVSIISITPEFEWFDSKLNRIRWCYHNNHIINHYNLCACYVDICWVPIYFVRYTYITVGMHVIKFVSIICCYSAWPKSNVLWMKKKSIISRINYAGLNGRLHKISVRHFCLINIHVLFSFDERFTFQRIFEHWRPFIDETQNRHSIKITFERHIFIIWRVL